MREPSMAASGADNFTDSMLQLQASDNNGIFEPKSIIDANGVITPESVQAGMPHWRPLTDMQDSLSISSLALDPLDPSGQTLMVGTGSESSYGAATNTSLGVGGQPIGLLKTFDEGRTWIDLGPSQLAGRIVSIVPSATLQNGLRSLLVAAFDGGGVFQSSNGGQTFALTLPGPVTDLVADPNDSHIVYAAVGLQGVFRSRDGGVTWSQIGTAQMASSRTLKLAVLGNGGATILFVATAGTGAYTDPSGNNNLSGVFRSTDPADAQPQWHAISPGNVPSPKGADIRSFALRAVDPTNPGAVYVAGDGGAVYRGDDNSQTWSLWGSRMGVAPRGRPQSNVPRRSHAS